MAMIFVFKSTGKHANADSLSHLPLPQPRATSSDPMVHVAFIVGQIQSLPVAAKKVGELACPRFVDSRLVD